MTRIIPWLALALSAAAMAITISSRSGTTSPEDGDVRKELYSVRDRLDALESGVEDLAARLEEGAGSGARLKVAGDVFKAPDQGAREKGGASDDRLRLEAMGRELASLRRQVENLESAPRPADAENPEFRNAVATAQKELHKERMAKFQKRMEESRLEAMEEFARSEGLGPDQTDALRKILADDMAHVRETFSFMDDSRMGRAERRDRLTAHREEVKGELGQVLTPEQAERFLGEVMGPGPGMPPPPRRMNNP